MNHVHDLLQERADQLDPPTLDVATIISEGSRRLRRRRARAAGAIGALAACSVLGAATLPGLLGVDGGMTQADVTFASAFSEREPAYAVGQTIHLDGRDFTVPTPVLAMVQTTAGVVYSDREGTVWSAPGDSSAVRVGTTDAKRPRLAADGPRAAWAEPVTDGTEFVVLDLGSGSLHRTPAAGDHRADPQAIALDGDNLYVRDSRGLVRVEYATQSTEVVSEWRGDLEVTDVEDGRIAHVVPRDDRARSLNGFVSPDIGKGPRVGAWTMLDLSDDGAYLLGETEPDTFAVFDIAHGTSEVISSPDHEFLIGYRWLDHDTYLALGMNRPWDITPVDLLRCDLAVGCSVAAPAIGTADGGMTLPVGQPMDG